MGNCLTSGTSYRYIIHDGIVYEKLVCSRCHRSDHSASNCYASTYADGSKIRFWCQNCNVYHSRQCDQTGSCTLI